MIYKQQVELRTKKRNTTLDITDEVNKIIRKSKINEGIVLIQAYHTTTGIVVNENEPNALEDVISYLSKQAPFNNNYRHDNPSLRKDCPEDEPINCDSHIKASCYSQSSLVWNVSNGKLDLGKYQRMLFQEFDGPCPRKYKSMRKYLVKIIGE